MMAVAGLCILIGALIVPIAICIVEEIADYIRRRSRKPVVIHGRHFYDASGTKITGTAVGDL